MTSFSKKYPENPENTPPTRPESLLAFGASLRLRREELGFTLDQLAQKTAISKPYLSNIETARAPGPPSEEKLRILAKSLAWNDLELLAAADWLRTPESVRAILRSSPEIPPRREDGAIDLDAMIYAKSGKKKPEPSRPSTPPKTAAADILKVRQGPVINRVAAGRAAEHGDMNYPAGIADEYIPAPDLPENPVKNAFALRISGDSMSPEYPEGEIIIVGPGEAEDGDDCVVRLGEDANFATTFKRIFFIRRGNKPTGEVESIRLVALNPKYAERVVGTEQVSGIYPLMYRLSPAKRGTATSGDRRHSGTSELGNQEAGGEGSFTTRVSIEHD